MHLRFVSTAEDDTEGQVVTVQLTAKEFLEMRLPVLKHRHRELTTRMRTIGLGPREAAEFEMTERQIARIEALLKRYG